MAGTFVSPLLGRPLRSANDLFERADDEGRLILSAATRLAAWRSALQNELLEAPGLSHDPRSHRAS
jgi:hypothetical protein